MMTRALRNIAQRQVLALTNTTSGLEGVGVVRVITMKHMSGDTQVTEHIHYIITICDTSNMRYVSFDKIRLFDT